jgi:hypothetical protein
LQRHRSAPAAVIFIAAITSGSLSHSRTHHATAAAQ